MTKESIRRFPPMTRTHVDEKGITRPHLWFTRPTYAIAPRHGNGSKYDPVAEDAKHAKAPSPRR